MKRRYVIVGNGELDEFILTQIQKDDFVIGVDRAAYWLIKYRIVPDVAIGDFDSTSEKELQTIKVNISNVLVYSPKKDATDTELAVSFAIKTHPEEVLLLGFSGTRLDHTLANIFLLEQLHHAHIPAVIRSRHNEIVLCDDKRVIQKNSRYPYCSILSLSETSEITLRGFVYDVTKKEIKRNQTLGVSNEVRENEGTVDVLMGTVLVIQSCD